MTEPQRTAKRAAPGNSRSSWLRRGSSCSGAALRCLAPLLGAAWRARAPNNGAEAGSVRACVAGVGSITAYLPIPYAEPGEPGRGQAEALVGVDCSVCVSANNGTNGYSAAIGQSAIVAGQKAARNNDETAILARMWLRMAR